MTRFSTGMRAQIIQFTRPLTAGVIVLTVVATAPLADEKRPAPELIAQDPFFAMEEFARCAARFDIAAMVHDKEGKLAGAEEYRGAARGALAVAQFFALQSVSEPMITNPAAPDPIQFRLLQVESFYELEIVNQGSLAERSGFDEDGFRYCFDLQPLQIRTIEAMRRAGMF